MANQPKKKQPFRFWPWNPSTAPRTTGKSSSSKQPKTTAPSKRPSLPPSTTAPSTKPSPVSRPTPRDEDPTPVEISTVQLSPEDEQELQNTYEPVTPPPSPEASPSRRATDDVLQQPTPPSRFSPAATTDTSPTPSQGVHRPQEVSQTQTTLQIEMHDEKTKEPESPAQESQTTQPPKQVEPDSQLNEPETMIPTSRTIPKGTPLTEQESNAVQEKTIAYPDSVADIYTSQVQEKQEMDVEKKEDTQANGETVTEEKPTPYQQTLEERHEHVDGESMAKDLEVTREISHHSQKTKITDEKNEEKQPDTQGSKMGLEEKQQMVVDPKIPRASATRGGHDLQTENKDGNKLAQKLNIKHWLHGGGEHGISIITLAGENSGASMHIGRKKLDTACSRKGSEVEEHPSAGRKVDDKALMDTPKMESTEVPSISTSVNSNVQSINNSLIHESSCVQEDPGVHLIFSTKPAKFANSKDEIRPIQSLQSAFHTNPAQSLTNQPIIKKGNA